MCIRDRVTLDQAYAATMVSSLDSKPTQSVVINGITPAIIDNMFIVNPPQEIRQEIEEGLNENQDSGILDVDFLEFNELEADALKDTEVNLEYSELDIDFLEADFLRDLLDVIEELEATTVKLVDHKLLQALEELDYQEQLLVKIMIVNITYL